MSIGSLYGGYSYGNYGAYSSYGMNTVGGVKGVGKPVLNDNPVDPVKKVGTVDTETGGKITDPQKARIAVISGHEDDVDPMELKALKKAGIVKCETCASRTYKDGSDEANVSFKSAAHVSPEQSTAAVASHEGMHVKNAVAKTSGNDAKLLNASVSISYATCPECGKRYASGGLTRTQIAYKQNDPYSQNEKSQDYLSLRGAFVNAAA